MMGQGGTTMATKKATSTAKKSATAPKPAAKAAAKKAPAKKAPAKKAAAKPKAPPSHEEISTLAYHYWEQSGHYDGKHFENWLRAEKELS